MVTELIPTVWILKYAWGREREKKRLHIFKLNSGEKIPQTFLKVLKIWCQDRIHWITGMFAFYLDISLRLVFLSAQLIFTTISWMKTFGDLERLHVLDLKMDFCRLESGQPIVVIKGTHTHTHIKQHSLPNLWDSPHPLMYGLLKLPL